MPVVVPGGHAGGRARVRPCPEQDLRLLTSASAAGGGGGTGTAFFVIFFIFFNFLKYFHRFATSI